jgi:hypothetical protein
MAVSQLSNSAPICEITQKPNSQELRIHVGVITMKRAPDHLGWRLVTAAVRRYRSLPPEGRALMRALFVAICLIAFLIRLIVIAEQ